MSNIFIWHSQDENWEEKFLNLISYLIRNLVPSVRNLREGTERNSSATGNSDILKAMLNMKGKAPKRGISQNDQQYLAVRSLSISLQ